MTTQNEKKERPKWQRFLLSPHFILLVIGLAILVYVLFRLTHWGNKIDENYINERGIYTDGKDTFDVIYPLTDEDGNIIANKSPHTILFFGNDPFADDRDSEDGLVNMIAKKAGAKVYNASVAGSYLAAQSESLKHTESGLDVYNFYWLCLYLCMGKDLDYFDWLESEPGATILPETKELRKLLETIDMNTVDTIAIMYDAADYHAGSMITNPDDEYDILSYTGNLQAGLQLLRQFFPKVRIIVLSPTYAYGLDDNGKLISSDQKIYYGGGKLSDYVIAECTAATAENASFLDNLYGTFNEDEVEGCLTDHVHLSQKGRELVADRFVEALTQFDQK